MVAPQSDDVMMHGCDVSDDIFCDLPDASDEIDLDHETKHMLEMSALPWQEMDTSSKDFGKVFMPEDNFIKGISNDYINCKPFGGRRSKLAPRTLNPGP